MGTMTFLIVLTGSFGGCSLTGIDWKGMLRCLCNLLETDSLAQLALALVLIIQDIGIRPNRV